MPRAVRCRQPPARRDAPGRRTQVVKETSRAVVAVTSAAVAVAAERSLRRYAQRSARWQRVNYRDRRVLLSAGPAATGAALMATGGLVGAPAAVLAGVSAAGLGLYDDLFGDSHARGLAGHLRALRAGRVTTGLGKLVGLVAAGLTAGLIERRRLAPALVDAALIAGTANLVNLLDLRPGRALKVVGLAATCSTTMDGPAGAVAAATAAAAAAAMPADLAEQVMIGDCGANGLGALLGWSLASGLGRRARVAALGVVVGLTLASERVSFTAVIEQTPWLAAIDNWGRR